MQCMEISTIVYLPVQWSNHSEVILNEYFLYLYHSELVSTMVATSAITTDHKILAERLASCNTNAKGLAVSQ